MKNLKKTKIVKLIDSIEHQGIGGKQIQLEKEGTISEILDTNFGNMSIAMYNLILRRIKIVNMPEETKIYYGHILETGLGYFIVEDEIEGD